MSRIVYEDEKVLEELFTGTFILDGLRMSEKEQRDKVLDIMHMAGINVDNEDDLVIGYEGAEDDNGISDAQYTKFTVSQWVNKKVPYKVEEEYVYGGVFDEKESALSKEEQDKIVFDEMRKEGKLDSDESNYDVVITGAEDNEGIYDSVVTGYSVYKITSKERLEEETFEEKEDIKNEEKEKLEEDLKLLKEEREKIASIEDIEARDKALKDLLDRLGNVTEEVKDIKDYSMFNNEIEEIDKAIKELNKQVKEEASKYEESYKKLQEIINEQNDKMNSDNLLGEDELQKLVEEYGERKLEENKNSIDILSRINNQKRLIRSLTRKKNALKRDLLNAEALDLTYDEYKDITSTLNKKNVMNSILAKKGLEDIINKNSKDRTKEEKKQLSDAKEEIKREIAELQNENKDISVLDAIEELYSIENNYKKEEEAKTLTLEADKLNNIKENSDLLPARIISDVVREKDYVPGKAPEEFDYDKVLINRSEFDSKTMVKEDEFKRIMGFDYDPSKYDINISEGVNSKDGEVVEELQIFEKVPKITKEETTPNVEANYNSNDVVERIVLFHDADTDEIFIRKTALGRFDIKPVGEEVRIDGALCYKLDEEDVDYIFSIADNPVSPYNVEVKEIKLNNGKVEEPKETPSEEVKPEKEEPKQDPDKVEEPKQDPDKVEEPKQEPGPDTDYDDKKKPDPSNTSGNIQDPVKPRIHVEEIIEELTNELDIHKKDGARFKASNIKVLKSFKDELRSGNWLYNVVHVGVAVVKVPINFIRKAIGKITTLGRGKKVMTEVKNRLDNLSEEKLDVLFNEYKGHQLKTDMNNQINPLIIDKLREYGLKKVEELNNSIKNNYAHLFTLLSQIKVVEEEMAKASGDKSKSLFEKRKNMMQAAALYVNQIEAERLEADNLLSSGVHGLEEDFKAVSTKLSYVGKRFAKVGKFDNELQAKLAKFGKELRESQANKDYEGIVNNFMGLECCYYENTKINWSLFGKRSVGAKYFSPVAEEFDYRNDPFFTDLLTTIVLTTGAISAVNSWKVNAANQQALRQHQAEINRVNQANNQTMQDVHTVGGNITSKGDSYMEGIRGGVHQDTLNIANTSERGAMDATDWGFGDYYRSLDSTNHEMYNNVYDNAVSRLDDIASKYTSGDISQIDALRQMADVQTSTQGSLVDVINEYKDICHTYADTHTQFDLHSTLSSLDYISANPSAITTMVESGISNLEEAAKLAGMTAEQATALSNLDSDLLTTLIGAGSAAALAGRVVRTMSDNAKGGKYKNANKDEIKAMFDEYYQNDEEEDTKSK